MTLIDTSVWIAHFAKTDLKLVELLDRAQVVTHPFVLNEIYLGQPKNKKFIFSSLDRIPQLLLIIDPEIRSFINEFDLVGKGLGMVDICLLASCYIAQVDLYTLDKKLASFAHKILRK